MFFKRAKGILAIIGIGFGLNVSGAVFGDDCLSRYRQLVLNQETIGRQQASRRAVSAADKNDLEVSYVLEAAKKIESGEWEYGEHTSIEMERFFSMILNLENPQMEPGYRSDSGELPVLLGYMDLAHMLNIASQKGFLCKNQQANGGFFDTIVKIRRDIRDGLLPSLVSYAEEQDLLNLDNSREDIESGGEDLFDLEDLSRLSHSSALSLTSLSDSSSFSSDLSEKTESHERDIDVNHAPELPSDNQIGDPIQPVDSEQSDPALGLEEADQAGNGEQNSLPDPNEVELIDLSDEPALTPSLEEREKSREQHFSELDELYR